MIEDWEIGQLYWNTLKTCGGDEREANRKVQQKYFYEFCSSRHDLYFSWAQPWNINVVVQPIPLLLLAFFIHSIQMNIKKTKTRKSAVSIL
ncbi:hypothetical protein [Dictyobacter arantiisoli]|uniref:hypothetical protein n=1 Tax=Dictyobacter arantiisoli TaxID=2014874 RepID=UPI001C0EAA15|nr:hypothetical protein [Dictyobacter arantiisoli]